MRLVPDPAPPGEHSLRPCLHLSLSQPGQVRSSRCEGAACWAHHAQSSEWDPHPSSEGPSGAGQGAAKANISRVNSSSSYCNEDELESVGRVQQGQHRGDPLKPPSQLEVCTASQPAAPQEQLGFPPQRVAPGAGGSGRLQGRGRWGPVSQDVRGLGGWRGLKGLCPESPLGACAGTPGHRCSAAWTPAGGQ